MPKEVHVIMRNGPVHHKDTTVMNIHVPRIRRGKHIKQLFTELNGEIDSNIIITGCTTSFPTADISRRQKISKETANLNKTIEQMIHVDICKKSLQMPQNTAFFSSAHKCPPRKYQMLDWKTSFTKFEILAGAFPNQSA